MRTAAAVEWCVLAACEFEDAAAIKRPLSMSGASLKVAQDGKAALNSKQV